MYSESTLPIEGGKNQKAILSFLHKYCLNPIQCGSSFLRLTHELSSPFLNLTRCISYVLQWRMMQQNDSPKANFRKQPEDTDRDVRLNSREQNTE